MKARTGVVFKTKMSSDRLHLYMANKGAGLHGDRRTKRVRTRSAAKRKAIAEQRQ